MKPLQWQRILKAENVHSGNFSKHLVHDACISTHIISQDDTPISDTLKKKDILHGTVTP